MGIMVVWPPACHPQIIIEMCMDKMNAKEIAYSAQKLVIYLDSICSHSSAVRVHQSVAPTNLISKLFKNAIIIPGAQKVIDNDYISMAQWPRADRLGLNPKDAHTIGTVHRPFL